MFHFHKNFCLMFTNDKCNNDLYIKQTGTFFVVYILE